MSGALAERDFVEKLLKAGFGDVEIPHRRTFGIDDCSMYPLFTPELIELMRELIPASRQQSVAMSIVIKATLPA